MSAPSSSPFHVPVDLGCTALLLLDIQTEILGRFPEWTQAEYLAQVCDIVSLFRDEISARRAALPATPSPYPQVPLIVHHVLPKGINDNAFVSPYNQLSRWVAAVLPADAAAGGGASPLHPADTIPAALVPAGGFGGPDEIVVATPTAGAFPAGGGELMRYLAARGIRHVVICGLTTAGAVLGSARGAADAHLHTVVVREAALDDDVEVTRVLMERVLPRFVDVVGRAKVEALFGARGTGQPSACGAGELKRARVLERAGVLERERRLLADDGQDGGGGGAGALESEGRRRAGGGTAGVLKSERQARVAC